ncbi:hypothetical protein PQQ97_39025, partial [Paraburkholderia sediminicola]
MNQPAVVGRNGPVTVAPGLIFRGTPSQVVTLPAQVAGCAGTAQLRPAATQLVGCAPKGRKGYSIVPANRDFGSKVAG